MISRLFDIKCQKHFTFIDITVKESWLKAKYIEIESQYHIGQNSNSLVILINREIFESNDLITYMSRHKVTKLFILWFQQHLGIIHLKVILHIKIIEVKKSIFGKGVQETVYSIVRDEGLNSIFVITIIFIHINWNNIRFWWVFFWGYKTSHLKFKDIVVCDNWSICNLPVKKNVIIYFSYSILILNELVCDLSNMLVCSFLDLFFNFTNNSSHKKFLNNICNISHYISFNGDVNLIFWNMNLDVMDHDSWKKFLLWQWNLSIKTYGNIYAQVSDSCFYLSLKWN